MSLDRKIPSGTAQANHSVISMNRAVRRRVQDNGQHRRVISLAIWFSYKDSRQVKIPQGKQFRTPVSQILQALQRHMGSLLSCLCSTVPEYGNAAHDFALLESQSFRQICLLTVLCTPTRILSEQIMLKGKICKFNFKQQQKNSLGEILQLQSFHTTCSFWNVMPSRSCSDSRAYRTLCWYLQEADLPQNIKSLTATGFPSLPAQFAFPVYIREPSL